MTADFHHVVIVMPTYNEVDTLAITIADVRAHLPDATLLIVDDGSPDGTGVLADEYAQADEHVYVLHRSHKAGLGAAYIAGFTWAVERAPQYIVEMDADGSHRAADLVGMLQSAHTSDLTIGSRWVSGGRVENWSRARLLLSRLGNTYVRLMLRMPVRDATAGFRVFKTAVLTSMDLADVHSAGYCFQVDMTRRVFRSGLTISEYPITFVERRAGRSKMSNAIVREALWRVTLWGLHDWLLSVSRRHQQS